MLHAVLGNMVYLPGFVVASILRAFFYFYRVRNATSEVSRRVSALIKLRRVFGRIELRLLLHVHVYWVLVLTQPTHVVVLGSWLCGCRRSLFRTCATIHVVGVISCLNVHYRILASFLLDALIAIYWRQNLRLVHARRRCRYTIILHLISNNESCILLWWRTLGILPARLCVQSIWLA